MLKDNFIYFFRTSSIKIKLRSISSIRVQTIIEFSIVITTNQTNEKYVINIEINLEQ